VYTVFAAVGGIDTDSETAESAAVFLFGFVFDSRDTHITQESCSKLHTYFGPVSPSLLADIYSAVEYILSCLSDTGIEKISAALDATKDGSQSMNKEFGRNIKAALCYSSAVNDDDLDWLESDEDSGMPVGASGFSMNYAGVNEHIASSSQVEMSVVQTDTSSSKQQKTRAWLYEEVASYFCTESAEPETCIDDLVSTVFDILCSSKSNEQLQTEVGYSTCALDAA